MLPLRSTSYLLCIYGVQSTYPSYPYRPYSLCAHFNTLFLAFSISSNITISNFVLIFSFPALSISSKTLISNFIPSNSSSCPCSSTSSDSSSTTFVSVCFPSLSSYDFRVVIFAYPFHISLLSAHCFITTMAFALSTGIFYPSDDIPMTMVATSTTKQAIITGMRIVMATSMKKQCRVESVSTGVTQPRMK